MLPEVLIYRNSSETPWSYAELEALQDRVAERVLAGGRGALIFSEVAPVVTLGKRTERERDLLLAEAEYDTHGVKLMEVGRGGLATWHGPGQWVVFAVDRLDRLCGDARGVRRAVGGLLEAARRASLPEEPEACVRWDAETGVWGTRGKLASVGVRIRQGVLLHGLALNVVRGLTSFYGIRLCGLDAEPQFLGDAGRVDLDEVRERLERALLEIFWRREGRREAEAPPEGPDQCAAGARSGSKLNLL